ncbi:MAG TPA: hypothetical protein VFM18_11710 [Methanosarcina sp.]|nr:hypothetical protein [Methanosarcina sp.]
MSHYVKVRGGKVIEAIVADPTFFNTFKDTSPGTWIQTSYNTFGNVHYQPNTRIPSGLPPLRGNYASVGMVYDYDHDVFYAEQPYPSWILNKTTWLWEAPKPYPTDGNKYIWNEATLSWVLAKF